MYAMKLSASEIKKIRSLSQKKFRDRYGLFIVEGEKMVAEAENSGFEIEAVWHRDEIGEETMSRISCLSSPSPVLAVVRKNIAQDILVQPKPGLYLGLDSMRDPGNLGTVIRLADWFGIDTIYATEDTVDVFNPKVVQSTMGAIFRVKVVYTDFPSAVREFTRAGGRVYGTFLEGDNIYKMDLDTGSDIPVMIVIGNESNGISDEVAALVSDKVHIPSFSQTGSGSESLNAAIATAVTISEFRRRLF